MPDASRELQKAVMAALKGNAPLVALVADRIYDNKVPLNAVKPYVSLGPEDWAQAEGIGQRSHAGSVQIDSWAGAESQMKQVAGTVQDALHEAKLTLDTQRLVNLLHRVTRYFLEADGLTNHAASEFSARTSEPKP